MSFSLHEKLFIKISTLISIVILATVAADAQNKTAGFTKLHLVELYSSEGCSSCPPADEQFVRLRKNSDLWKTFVPVGFHVDYWNRLGWTDRFSNKAFSERQRRYSDHWQKSKVYTPAFVINGSDAGPSLSPVFNTPTTDIGIKVSLQKNNIKTTVVGLKQKSYVLHFVILANGLKSKVLSGENSGRLLEHEFTVVHLESKQTVLLEPSTWTMPQIQLGQRSLSYAFWITELNDPTPLQAIGGDL